MWMERDRYQMLSMLKNRLIALVWLNRCIKSWHQQVQTNSKLVMSWMRSHFGCLWFFRRFLDYYETVAIRMSMQVIQSADMHELSQTSFAGFACEKAVNSAWQLGSCVSFLPPALHKPKAPANLQTHNLIAKKY